MTSAPAYVTAKRPLGVADFASVAFGIGGAGFPGRGKIMGARALQDIVGALHPVGSVDRAQNKELFFLRGLRGGAFLHLQGSRRFR